ncbi:hypothetical protein D3C71_1665330 [compost metagenome]
MVACQVRPSVVASAVHAHDHCAGAHRAPRRARRGELCRPRLAGWDAGGVGRQRLLLHGAAKAVPVLQHAVSPRHARGRRHRDQGVSGDLPRQRGRHPPGVGAGRAHQGAAGLLSAPADAGREGLRQVQAARKPAVHPRVSGAVRTDAEDRPPSPRLGVVYDPARWLGRVLQAAQGDLVRYRRTPAGHLPF